jgi:hypothetical protein
MLGYGETALAECDDLGPHEQHLHAGQISVWRYRVYKRPFIRRIVRRPLDWVLVRLGIRLRRLFRLGWCRRRRSNWLLSH